MSKQFIEGNVYVFVAKKVLKRVKDKKDIKDVRDWANEINGKQVTMRNKFDAKCDIYSVSPEWCKCISNKAKPLSVDEIQELDEELCEYCEWL